MPPGPALLSRALPWLLYSIAATSARTLIVALSTWPEHRQRSNTGNERLLWTVVGLAVLGSASAVIGALT